MGLLHHLVWLRLVFRHFWGINVQPFVNYFVWLRIIDEGSIPDMRIWPILLIKSDLKWCIDLSRSLFLYFDAFLTSFLDFVILVYFNAISIDFYAVKIFICINCMSFPCL